MSCHRFSYFKAHKLYEQSIIISLDITKGLFSFELINLTTEERIKMGNPEKGTYEYPLKKENKYKLVITAKGASGKYKIQRKTIKLTKLDNI